MSANKSTTVRPQEPATLPPLRLGLRALASLSPALAARAAERLFSTPRRRPRPLDAERILCSAETFPLRVGRRRLEGWRWGEGPAVLLVHGWEGQATQLAAFVPALVEAGCSVVAWDAPGHGSSSGGTSSLPEFADALWAAARAPGVGPVHGLVAHSMGAAAATLALSEGLPLNRAVLVAPPRDLATYCDRFAELLALPVDVRRRMVRSLERRFGLCLEQLSFEALEARTDLPMLLVHDAEDREVPIEVGRAIVERWPGATLHETHGLGHHRILADPEVVRRAVRFLTAELAATPGGRGELLLSGSGL